MEGKLSKGAGKEGSWFTDYNSIFPPKICCLKRRVKPSQTKVFTRKTAKENRGKPTISVLLLMLLLLITSFYLRRRGEEGDDPCTMVTGA